MIPLQCGNTMSIPCSFIVATSGRRSSLSGELTPITRSFLALCCSSTSARPMTIAFTWPPSRAGTSSPPAPGYTMNFTFAGSIP